MVVDVSVARPSFPVERKLKPLLQFNHARQVIADEIVVPVQRRA
jgi:hypothetical protein